MEIESFYFFSMAFRVLIDSVEFYKYLKYFYGEFFFGKSHDERIDGQVLNVGSTFSPDLCSYFYKYTLLIDC